MKMSVANYWSHRQIRSAPPPPPASDLSATLQGRRKAVEAVLRAIQQYKTKKGDRCLPRINYFCIANYVQALNP